MDILMLAVGLLSFAALGFLIAGLDRV